MTSVQFPDGLQAEMRRRQAERAATTRMNASCPDCGRTVAVGRIDHGATTATFESVRFRTDTDGTVRVRPSRPNILFKELDGGGLAIRCACGRPIVVTGDRLADLVGRAVAAGTDEIVLDR